jgi:hypothetical protein
MLSRVGVQKLEVVVLKVARRSHSREFASATVRAASMHQGKEVRHVNVVKSAYLDHVDMLKNTGRSRSNAATGALFYDQDGRSAGSQLFGAGAS